MATEVVSVPRTEPTGHVMSTTNNVLESPEQYFDLLRQLVPVPSSGQLSQNDVLHYTMEYIRELEAMLQRKG